VLVNGITQIGMTARSLRDHAEALKTMVSRFKSDDERMYAADGS
jgi:Asp-tRNA(Asn)/Glu-tRNA(Gln) amidotransferase A subunit family amidase